MTVLKWFRNGGGDSCISSHDVKCVLEDDDDVSGKKSVDNAQRQTKDKRFSYKSNNTEKVGRKIKGREEAVSGRKEA